MKINKEILKAFKNEIEELKLKEEKFLSESLYELNKKYNLSFNNENIEIGYSVRSIDIPMNKGKSKTHTYIVIGAKNVFTALLLEAVDNIKDLPIKTISEYNKYYQHETFLHVPESLHYLSSEVVYEVNDYKVYYIKELELFKAEKI